MIIGDYELVSHDMPGYRDPAPYKSCVYLSIKKGVIRACEMVHCRLFVILDVQYIFLMQSQQLLLRVIHICMSYYYYERIVF